MGVIKLVKKLQENSWNQFKEPKLLHIQGQKKKRRNNGYAIVYLCNGKQEQKTEIAQELKIDKIRFSLPVLFPN